MTAASWSVQKGLYAVLTGDAPLMAIVKKVWDGVPPGQYKGALETANFPYMTIGDSIETPDDTHSREGSESTLTMHIWSRYQGDREVKQIFERLWVILHNSRWVVPGFSVVMSHVELAEALRDPDGITRHGVMRVRVVVQEVI
jgi:hypothetical protein